MGGSRRIGLDSISSCKMEEQMLDSLMKELVGATIWIVREWMGGFERWSAMGKWYLEKWSEKVEIGKGKGKHNNKQKVLGKEKKLRLYERDEWKK